MERSPVYLVVAVPMGCHDALVYQTAFARYVKTNGTTKLLSLLVYPVRGVAMMGKIPILENVLT